MSQVQPVGSAMVRAAIARAAEATGTDFDYLLAQARIESAMDPSARAATSSAAGLYQFTAGTWLQTLARHGAEHGLQVPASRAEALAMRFDPATAALMAGELAGDNRAALVGALGREPDAAELYLAHFLGEGGARRFLTALASDPAQSAATLLPQAAAANRAIFYSPGGAARSLGEVMDLLRGKVAAAMGGAARPEFDLANRPQPEAGALTPRGPLAREFHTAPPRPSMAETLRATFGAADAGTPAPVRAAYDKLRALGL